MTFKTQLTNSALHTLPIIGAFWVMCGCLTSCSADHYLAKAIKKDPSIIQERVVIVEKEIPGVWTDTTAIDTLLIDNDRIRLSAIAKGKIDLSYYIKPIRIIDTTETRTVNIPEKPSIAKTKARQQGRTDRKGIEADKKVELAKEKTNKIVKKKELKSLKWYTWFWIGFSTCLIFFALLYFSLKRYFK